jgi:hypothetical protein
MEINAFFVLDQLHNNNNNTPPTTTTTTQQDLQYSVVGRW